MPLTVASLAEAKGFSPSLLAQYGVRNGQGGVVIPFHDQAGNEYIRFHIRREPKADGKGEWFWSKGDAPILPYGLHRPVPYSKGMVWIVEGESDCWTLWHHEVPALGLPGATTVGGLQLAHLEGVHTVAVVQEPGEAGERFPTRVANRLFDLGFEGKVYAVTLSEKDPRALWLAKYDGFLEALKADFRKRRLIEPPKPIVTAAATSSISIADLWDMPTETVDWLCDGLIPEAGIALLCAKPKVGKSVTARNLALSIARGRRFLGRACKGGLVLWLSLEERKEQVVPAFKAMGALPQDRLRFYFGMAPEDAMAWLQRECEAFQVSCVVIDTWAKLTRVENINDYSQVNRANEPLMRLSREKGIAQIWVHHNNKSQSTNGDEILGSSALFAAADCVLTLTRSNDGTRYIRSLQRLGGDMEETIIGMDEDTFLISSTGSKFTLAVDTARKQIERALFADALSRDEIAKAVESRWSVTLSALNELLRAGIVLRSGTGKRGDPHRYALNAGLTETFDDSEPAKDSESLFPVDIGNYRNGGTGNEKPVPAERNGLERAEQAERPPEDDDLLMKYADEKGLFG